jgi:hypothetical protein
LEIKLITKEEIPKESKITNQGTTLEADGTKISYATLERDRPAVSARYTRGFAKLKFTKYYPLFGKWVLAVTK